MRGSETRWLDFEAWRIGDSLEKRRNRSRGSRSLGKVSQPSRVKSECASRLRALAMNDIMAINAQRDQVLLSVLSTLAAELLIMIVNLKSVGTATLAFPGVLLRICNLRASYNRESKPQRSCREFGS